MVHAPLMLMNFGKNMCLNLVVQILIHYLHFLTIIVVVETYVWLIVWLHLIRMEGHKRRVLLAMGPLFTRCSIMFMFII